MSYVCSLCCKRMIQLCWSYTVIIPPEKNPNSYSVYEHNTDTAFGIFPVSFSLCSENTELISVCYRFVNTKPNFSRGRFRYVTQNMSGLLTVCSKNPLILWSSVLASPFFLKLFSTWKDLSLFNQFPCKQYCVYRDRICPVLQVLKWLRDMSTESFSGKGFVRRKICGAHLSHPPCF